MGFLDRLGHARLTAIISAFGLDIPKTDVISDN